MIHKIRICEGVECKNCGSDDLFKDAQRLADGRENVTVEKRSCMAKCNKAPNVQITDENGKEVACHSMMDPNGMQKIIESL